MTNGQRTVTTLLAVVAVMLGLNLIVRGSPTAVAQGPTAAGPVQATPVSIAAVPSGSGTKVYRLWSDGSIDVSGFNYSATDICGPISQCGPFTVIPGSCMADVDHDGQVAVPDLLSVLGTWGPCP